MSEWCTPELIREALEAVRASIRSYLAANCKRTLSMARLAGQQKVKLEYHGFYRHYRPTPAFPKFTEAIKYLSTCMETRTVDVDGIEVDTSTEGVAYATISISRLEELCQELQSQPQAGAG